MANDTYATRAFTFGDRTVAKGEDVTKLDPKVPEQQIDDFRHAGLVDAKPVDAAKAELDTKKA